MSAFPMIPIPDAQRIVLEQTRVLGVEEVGVGAAFGRVLASTVTASDALPPFPASIKVGVSWQGILRLTQPDMMRMCRTGMP